MADEAPPQDARKKKRIPTTLVIVVVVTIVEGVGFYAAAKLFGGGPQASFGEPGEHYAQGENPMGQQASAEVVLLERFKAPNIKSGRLYIYDLDIVIKVPAHEEEEIEKLVADRKGEISDIVARIVRSADPRVLAEDELKTLRMQVQHALTPVFDDDDEDLVERVLIPRCVPILSG
jgi:flagellar basal body-associated protein FliL